MTCQHNRIITTSSNSTSFVYSVKCAECGEYLLQDGSFNEYNALRKDKFFVMQQEEGYLYVRQV